MTQGSGGYMTRGSGGYMTRGSGGYIFNANIEPSRFSKQWLDWGVWKIWSSAIHANIHIGQIQIQSYFW